MAESSAPGAVGKWIEFHRQRGGEPWRSMMMRVLRLRISASAWADYAIITLQVGYWHRSLEIGWRGYVHGVRIR